jgi:hypothetical protein
MIEIASEPRGRTVLAGFALLAAAASVPVASVRLPPILDYPNHLARMHVLAHLAASPDLARYYATAWSAIPDLAMDAVVPVLARAMPVEAAMRIFLCALLLGAAGGCLMLHRALWRRWSAWPLVAFLLLYNRMLLWGFLNYLAGLTLALWALAAWAALGRRPGLRFAVGTLLGTLVYLAHLAAFGAYAVTLLAYAAAPAGGDRERFRIAGALPRLAPALATLLPALLLFLASPTAGAPAGIGYGNPLRKLDLPVSIFDDYNRIFDGATFALVTAGLIAGLARGGVTLHPRLRWSVLALLLVFLLLPSRLLSASGIDHRLPVAIAFLLAAGTDWPHMAPVGRQRVAACLLLLFAVRLAIVECVWLAADRSYAALMPAFDLVPRGGRLAVAAPAEATRAGGVPLLHFPTLAVLRRDAFVPTLFADPAQQPIRLTAPAASLARGDEPARLWQRLAEGQATALPGFDALMIVDPPATLDDGVLPGPIVFRAKRLALVRVESGPAAGP